MPFGDHVLQCLLSPARNVLHGISLWKPATNHAWIHTILTRMRSNAYFGGPMDYTEFSTERKKLPHISVEWMDLMGTVHKYSSTIAPGTATTKVSLNHKGRGHRGY